MARRKHKEQDGWILLPPDGGVSDLTLANYHKYGWWNLTEVLRHWGASWLVNDERLLFWPSNVISGEWTVDGFDWAATLLVNDALLQAGVIKAMRLAVHMIREMTPQGMALEVVCLPMDASPSALAAG